MTAKSKKYEGHIHILGCGPVNVKEVKAKAKARAQAEEKKKNKK